VLLLYEAQLFFSSSDLVYACTFFRHAFLFQNRLFQLENKGFMTAGNYMPASV